MKKLKKIGLILLILGYIAAGLNHFRVPGFYISIVPPWLPHPAAINIAAGCCEVILGILLIFSKTRRFAAWVIIFMLIAFLPVHIEMMRNTPYILNGSTVSPLLAWIRLVVIQPLLILWAWWYTWRN